MQVSREQERKWQETILPPVQVFVEFYHDDVIDIQASNLAGTRVMKNVLLIKKKVKGDRFSLLTAEAKEADIRQYPNEYNQYMRSQNDNQESNNQESNSNRGRSTKATIASGRINKPKRGVETNNLWTKTKGQSGIKGVRTGRSEVRSRKSRQAYDNKSPHRGSFIINYGTFVL